MQSVLKPKPNWPAIKLAWQSGEGSYRELAKRFNVSFSTLEKRARREGWRQEMARYGDIAAKVATETATAQGQAIGLTAARLVERTIAETERFLDVIAEKLAAGELDPQSLRQLTLSWRDVVGVARTAFELDAVPQPYGQINVVVLSKVKGLPSLKSVSRIDEMLPEAEAGPQDGFSRPPDNGP